MTRTSRLAGVLALAVLSGVCGTNTGTAQHGAPTLTATPNPLPHELWPWSGATTIRWNTGDGTNGRVLVSLNGEPEQLFAMGSAGTQTVQWIATGPTYRFRLESAGPSPTSLASLVVTRRDDDALALELAGIAAVIGVGALWFPAGARRRSWLLEAGFLSLVLAPVWVVFVRFSTELRFFKAAAAPDRTVISATLACLLLVWAPLPLLGRRLRAVVAVVLGVALTSLGVADLIHARFFDTVITIGELTTVSQLALVPSSVTALVQWNDARAYLACGVMAVLLVPYWWACHRVPRLHWRERAAWSAALLVAALGTAWPTIRLARADPAYFADSWANREAVGRMGLLTFHVDDAVTHVATRIRQSTIDEADRRAVVDTLDGLKAVQAVRSPLFGIARGMNVILINSESINAFPLGLRVGGQPVAPNLEALTEESLSFSNVYDQAHLGKSSDAELLVLESLHPLPDAAYAARYPTRRPHGLPAILRDDGYSTLSATGTVGEIWNMNLRHPLQPFEQSYFEGTFPGTERFNGGVADRDFFVQMAQRLEHQRQPFLAFLMSASSHVPYELPPAHRSLAVGPLEGTLLGRYLQAVNYFDRSLGAFVDELRSSGLLDRTVLVVYGDHHAYQDDPGALAALLGVNPESVLDMWRAQARIPLLIRLPQGQGAGPRPVTGGLIDVAPTVLHLLGIDDPGVAMFGQDLTTGKQGLVVFPDGSFIDGQHLYLARAGANAAPACYEVTSGEPLACAPLESAHQDAVGRLRASDLIVEDDLIPSLVTTSDSRSTQ